MHRPYLHDPYSGIPRYFAFLHRYILVPLVKLKCLDRKSHIEGSHKRQKLVIRWLDNNALVTLGQFPHSLWRQNVPQKRLWIDTLLITDFLGSGCSSVGRAVASEVSCTNPVISKLLYGKFLYCQLYWKDENKEKEAGMAHFLKKYFCYGQFLEEGNVI